MVGHTYLQEEVEDLHNEGPSTLPSVAEGGGDIEFLSKMTRLKNSNSGLVEWDFMGATSRSKESDYNGGWTTGGT